MISMDAILKRTKQIPSLSSSALRLAKLVKDPDSTAAHFEATIKPDAALTVNLLKIANSAYFGFSREVTSVKQAVSLIGLRQTCDFAMGMLFGRVVPERIPGYELKARDFWMHSIATGVLAERICLDLHLQVAEVPFTAGLLHDIGKLVIGNYLAESAGQISIRLEDTSKDFLAVERELLGVDHATVGATVAEVWHIPEALAHVCRGHHHPGEVPRSPHLPLVEAVHIANLLAHATGYGADVGGMARSFDEEILNRHGLSASKLEEITCQCVEKIEGMGQALLAAAGVKA